LAGAHHAHLFDSDAPTADIDNTGALEIAHGGPEDAGGLKPVVHHGAALRLLETPSEGVRDVIEALRHQRERWARVHHAGRGYRPLAHVDMLVEYGRVQEPVDVDLATRRVQDLDSMGHPVKGQALYNAGETQAVVSVEMGDADAAEGPGRHAGQQELALGALARIEQDPFVIPA